MALLAFADLKARLCDISWMARKRFWFAVAPIMYAVTKNRHERNGVLRSRYAQRIWSETTKRTTYLVKGSGPQSLVTWVQLVNGNSQSFRASYLGMGFDDSLSSRPVRFLCISPEEVVVFDLYWRWGSRFVLWFNSHLCGAFVLHGAGRNDCGNRGRHLY